MSEEDSSQAAAGRRNWRGFVLRLLGSAALLGALLLLLPKEQLFQALRKAPLGVWVVGPPIYLCLHLIGVAKWRLMVNAAGGGLAARDAVRCYYYGLFGNTFLPSVIGGDAVRVVAAFRSARSRTGVAVGSVAERVLDLTALAAVAGAGALLLPRALDERTKRVFLLVAALGVTLVAAAVLAVWMVGKTPERVQRLWTQVRAALGQTARQPGKMALALMLGISLQTLLVMLNAWLGAMCGVDIPIALWLFAWPTAKISALLPVSLGGLGVREAALAALLAPLGVSPALAVAAGIAFQAIILSGGLTGGLLAFILGRTGANVERSDAKLAPRDLAG